jgi:hypothetical protein
MFFSFPQRSSQLCDIPSFLFRRYLVCFLGVKWVGHEVSHYPPSTRFGMSGAVPLLTPYALMACTGKMFTFPLDEIAVAGGY